jgi:hypothetical protein
MRAFGTPTQVLPIVLALVDYIYNWKAPRRCPILHLVGHHLLDSSNHWCSQCHLRCVEAHVVFARAIGVAYHSGIPCSWPKVTNNYFRSFFPFAMDKFRFSRFTHSPWLRVLKVFARFAYRIMAVGWQGTQDILTVQFRILPPIFSVIRATTKVTGPLLARRSVLLVQFVGAWDWVLGLAALWSPHRHGVREQGCHHHPLL